MEASFQNQLNEKATLPNQFLRYRDYILVVTILLISLTGNFWFWQLAQSSVTKTARGVFDIMAHTKTDLVKEAIEEGVELLEEGKSLYAAEPQMTRKEFNAFFQNEFFIEAHKYKGVRGVVWIDIPIKKDDYLLSVRNDKSISNAGFPYFDIFPSDTGAGYAVISNAVPFVANKELIGYNLYSDPYFAELLDKARDEGEEVISDKRILLNKSAIIAIAPLYDSTKQKSTIELRRAAIKGYLAVILDTEEMNFTTENSKEHYSLRLYDRPVDSNNVASYTPIYEELEDVTLAGTPLTSFSNIHVVDSDWTVVISSTHQAQISSFQRHLPTALFVAGTVFSLLLFAYTSSLLLKDPESDEKKAK